MKKRIGQFFIAAILFSTAVTSCRTKPSIEENGDSTSINKWIYEQMEIFYLWNHKIPQKPNYSVQPQSFFNNLLYKFHETNNPDGDRFSIIQENYTDLMNSLSGISSGEIGFEYILTRIEKEKPEIAILVLYPKKGSDAHAKGIKRGQWITAINGTTLTDANYKTLLGGNGAMKLAPIEFVYNESEKKYEEKQLPEITVQRHPKFAEKPIYMDTTYTIGDKKIGYMVYNFFATGPGNENLDYDKELMAQLSAQPKDISDFIIDLRYNSGGTVSSAIALASAFVKNRSTQKLLIQTEYNALVQPELEKAYGKDYFKTFFADKIMNKETLVANIPSLNLSNLYVITGKFTASASELIINGLKPHMNVVLIGDTTVGKNVGSTPFYEKDNPKNSWGILPITFKYYNSEGKSDFTSGFKPQGANLINEFQYPLIEFGDTKEPLLNRALSIITGDAPSLRSTRLRPDNDWNYEILKTPRNRPSELLDNTRENIFQQWENKRIREKN